MLQVAGVEDCVEVFFERGVGQEFGELTASFWGLEVEVFAGLVRGDAEGIVVEPVAANEGD